MNTAHYYLAPPHLSDLRASSFDRTAIFRLCRATVASAVCVAKATFELIFFVCSSCGHSQFHRDAFRKDLTQYQGFRPKLVARPGPLPNMVFALSDDLAVSLYRRRVARSALTRENILELIEGQGMVNAGDVNDTLIAERMARK